jgi:hypothetical protein
MAQNGHPEQVRQQRPEQAHSEQPLEFPVTTLRATIDRSRNRPLQSEQLQNLALVQLALIVTALVALALTAS